MGMFKQLGLAEPISLILVAVCLVVGGYFMKKSDDIDNPIEEAAEAVLESQGIDVDFSQDKKKKLEEAKKKKARERKAREANKARGPSND